MQQSAGAGAHSPSKPALANVNDDSEPMWTGKKKSVSWLNPLLVVCNESPLEREIREFAYDPGAFERGFRWLIGYRPGAADNEKAFSPNLSVAERAQVGCPDAARRLLVGRCRLPRGVVRCGACVLVSTC